MTGNTKTEKNISTDQRSSGIDGRSIDKIGIYSLLVIVLVSLLLMYVSSVSLQKNKYMADHDTWVDNAGRLHVLGIVLGQTTLRSAEKALKSRSDVALYLYPGEKNGGRLSLEAFFPSIADHSKVVLGLKATNEKIMDIKSKASQPRTYPNGVARMNLANSDVLSSQRLTVAWIKYVPSVSLDNTMLSARFGQPDFVRNTANGKHFIYKSIGLDAFLGASDEKYCDLTFMQPDLFVIRNRLLNN